MTSQGRVAAAFYRVATGTLRVAPGVASEFSGHIATANDAIHIASALCTGSNQLQSATLHAMLIRWFNVLAEYDMPRRLLEAKPGEIAAVREIDKATGVFCHSRVFEVCVSQRRLAETQAAHVATYVTGAISAFFAFEQACRAPEDHAQKVLCSLLRALVGRPLVQAQAAAAIYLQGA